MENIGILFCVGTAINVGAVLLSAWYGYRVGLRAGIEQERHSTALMRRVVQSGRVFQKL